MYLAYTIFNNTYAKPKQADIERIVNYFAELMGMGNDYSLQCLDPIGLQIDSKDVINSFPKSFVFEYFNIPKDKWDEPNIGSDNKPSPPYPLMYRTAVSSTNTISRGNENIKNLSGRQRVMMEGYIKRYNDGKATWDYTSFMLKKMLGFTDEDIVTLIGLSPQHFAKKYSDDEVVEMFELVGEFKSDYEIVKVKGSLFVRGRSTGR